MKNEFSNRQSMHEAVLAYLAPPASRAIWDGKPPIVFTQKAAELKTLVVELGKFIRDQEAIIKGFAEEKAREENDVEVISHEIGSVLAGYYLDRNREPDARAVDHSPTEWLHMRDASLVEQARLVHQKLVAALADDVDGLAAYGLDANDAANLLREIDEYAAVIASPAAAIANRRALTSLLRPRFREVSRVLQSMDRLVLRFRSSPGGVRFVEGWEAARVIRDLGYRSADTPPTPEQPD